MTDDQSRAENRDEQPEADATLRLQAEFLDGEIARRAPTESALDAEDGDGAPAASPVRTRCNC